MLAKSLLFSKRIVIYLLLCNILFLVNSCSTKKDSTENKSKKEINEKKHVSTDSEGEIDSEGLYNAKFGAFNNVEIQGDNFDVFIVNPKEDNLRFFHKNGDSIIASISRLIELQAKDSMELIFAMNGGMYRPNLSPEGLYVEEGKQLYPIKMKTIKKPFTNFYSLPPNGVFYLSKNGNPGIIKRENYESIADEVLYATQSSPLLVFDGKINEELNPNSESKYVRNGVGIKEDGSIVFAISEEPVRFYDFARLFQKSGCTNALYLDGAISEMYLPEINRQDQSGNFAVLIAVSKKMAQ